MTRLFLILILCLVPFVQTHAAEKQQDLDFGFLGRLAKSRAGENVVISSTNLEKAFQLLALGADGAVRHELDGYLALYPSEKTLALSSVKTALCLWAAPRVAFNSAFVQEAKAQHQTARLMQSLDAVRDINGCVSDATNGQIKNLLPPGDWNAVLATALYFKGRWTIPFDKNLTKDDTFTGPKGERLVAAFMKRSGHYAHAKTAHGQLVQIPYEEDDLVLTLYLPDEALPSGAQTFKKEDGGLWSWLDGMDLATWRKQIAAMKPEIGLVKLPKIDVKFKEEISSKLAAFGLPKAFAPGAEYARILDGEAFKLDRVYHQTVVRWDEEETEASAATSGAAGGAAYNPGVAPFEMVLDHPFFFTIGDRQNARVLFSGVVTKP